MLLGCCGKEINDAISEYNGPAQDKRMKFSVLCYGEAFYWNGMRRMKVFCLLLFASAKAGELAKAVRQLGQIGCSMIFYFFFGILN